MRTTKGLDTITLRGCKLTSIEFKRLCVVAGFPLSVRGNVGLAANALGISVRTLERYKNNGCTNRPVINLLNTMAFGVSQSASWQGWRISAQYLVTPGGDHIRQSDLLVLWANRKAKKHLETRLANVENMLTFYHDKDKENKIVNLDKYKQIAKLANDIEDLVGHYSQLSRAFIE